MRVGHYEGEGEKQGVVIGTVFPDGSWPQPLVSSDTGLPQIWGDYIKAPTDCDLEKIA